MAVSRVHIVDKNFVDFVQGWNEATGFDSLEIPITRSEILGLFESQMTSRLLDFAARSLKDKNQAYYTIGSSGHEGNAALGLLIGEQDPCFLHYRSGAFMVEHLKKDPSARILEAMVMAFCASSKDPVSGGRHKVFGSKRLWVPPQTSTIASHLPKAVGLAMALERSKRLKLELSLEKNTIVMCSFGDASVNHSTAQGAINAACWAAYQKIPVPILFVCEDNGLGISVKSPKNWVMNSIQNRPGLFYFNANGLDLFETVAVSKQAIDTCRKKRQPVFLHLDMVRLLGHAGSDVESEYMSKSELEQMDIKDPLHVSAARILSQGWLSKDKILSFYQKKKLEIEEVCNDVIHKPRLQSATQITKALAPFDKERTDQEASRGNYKIQDLESDGAIKPRHMAMLLNYGLKDLLTKYKEALVFGEDVGKKGGVYHVTTGLQDTFGAGRVFNTLLDEQTILGLAIGAAHIGFLPIPEIQYLAYVHNAEDQLRGEAASLQFFSNGQFQNPMIVRIASFGYQKGFGGHFHNDNSIGALRDIPGLVLGAPSRGDDAVGMLRYMMAMAKINGSVGCFLEPIALYMTKDLYSDHDGLWSFEYPQPEFFVPLGEPRIYFENAKDILLISYANGAYFCLRVAKELSKLGYDVSIIDLRWLSPLPLEAVLEHAK
ncbi:MAG: hypothetical protein KDD48_04145, partial [Bdellovibrionales bacterium]|nr:hypothetical protein [Bdellovibrionales bacterium]